MLKIYTYKIESIYHYMPWSKLYARAGPGKQINTDYSLPYKKAVQVELIVWISLVKNITRVLSVVFLEDFFVYKGAEW